jgi:type VI secretion system secreted protein Hcp
MAFNAFVNFGDIKGESTDKDHKDWVMIQSYSQSVTHQPSIAQKTAAGRSAERAHFSEFSIKKLMDAATPKLFEACCKGTHLKEVVIELVRAGSKPVKYLEIKLTDVIITSIAHSVDPTPDVQFPTETVSMTFGAIEYTYTKQKPDGTAAGNVSAKWNVAQGAAA